MGLIEHSCYWDNFQSTIKFTVSPIYYVSKAVNWSAIWWELCKLSSFTYSQIWKASVLQVARLAHQAFYRLNFNTIFIFQSVDKAQMWFALLEDFILWPPWNINQADFAANPNITIERDEYSLAKVVNLRLRILTTYLHLWEPFKNRDGLFDLAICLISTGRSILQCQSTRMIFTKSDFFYLDNLF